MKVVFWGSSDFSIPPLKYIYQKHNIEAVVTNPDACYGRGMKELRTTPVKKFALEHGIPVFQPESIKDESFYRKLACTNPDLFIVVSYGMIIPERILLIPRFRSINLHASLLPKYRGASPMQTAIANGDTETGFTVQYMSKEMDKGDIILQKKTVVYEGDNYLSLSSRLSEEGSVLLMQAVELIEKGQDSPIRQNDEEATYTKLIKKEDGKISFVKDSAHEIFNKWRAYFPWPGIFTEYKNLDVYPGKEGNGLKCSNISVHLTEIFPVNSKKQFTPGVILSADKNGLVIACREDALSIVKIKPSGKKEMDYISFINGYKPAVKKYF